MKNSLSNSQPFFKIIFTLFIVLVSFLIVFIIGFLVAVPIFHINIGGLSEVLSDYSDPNNIKFLKYLQTLQAIGLFIIPAFIIGYFFHSSSTSYLKFKPTTTRVILLTIFVLLAFNIRTCSHINTYPEIQFML